MAFKFGRRSARREDSRAQSVVLDRTNGVPEVASAVAQLAAGDWQSVESAYGDNRDWALRGALVQALGDLDPSDEWTSSCPRSSLAQAVRGSQLRRLAWDIRGGGKASTVSKTAFGDFFATLRGAEQAIRRAIELAPDDPDPWSQLIWTGTGLQVSKDEILTRFAAMHERDANHINGWLAVTSAMAKKWGGSHQAMFDVAHQGDRDLPSGSVGRVGLVRAHEERRLYLAHWENDALGARSYFKRPDVAHEVSAAALNSVLSPEHRHGASTRLAQSWFAYALALVGDAVPSERRRAATLFTELGDTGIPSQPWLTCYGSSGGEQYARIRAVCSQAADLHSDDSNGV